MSFFSKSKFLSLYLPMILIGAVIFTSIFIYSGSKVAEAGWYSTGGTWVYRKQITVDHTKVSGASNLTDFPMLFSVTDPELKFTGSGGKVASSTGLEIVFTSSDGTTKLSYEMEYYASTTGQMIAWVKIPTLSISADTTIYLYFGGPIATDQSDATNVWASSYKAVYHLGNGTTLSATDSTTNAKNGTITGATATTGKFNGAGAFSGDTQYIDLPTNVVSSNVMTVSTWATFTATDTFYGLFAYGPADDDRMEIVVNAGTSLYGGNYNGRAISASGSISTTGWYYITLTSTGSVTQLYINGVASGTTGTTNFATFSGISNIGRRIGSTNFRGSLDEVRVANAARSADWIKTEYNNQNSPSTFYSYGALGVQTRSASTASVGINNRGASSVGWYSSGGTWTYRKQITVDHTKVSGASNLTDFPMLFSVTDPELKFTGSGGLVASSTGLDILFTSSDGTTKLSYEMEYYASTTGQVIAWVKIPTLSITADNVIYMYYGNASASDQSDATNVWNSNFASVWHMNDDPSITTDGNCAGGTKEICDSTVNNNDMDSAGTMTASDLVTGGIGKAVDFDGSDDYLNGAITGAGSSDNTATVSGWVNARSVGVYDSIIESRVGGLTLLGLLISGGSGSPVTYDWDGDEFNTATGLTLTNNNWYYVAMIINGNTANMYLGDQNGNLRTYSDASSNSSYNLNATWDIARDSAVGGRFWDGPLDEMRIINTNMTDGWIRTEYANQYKPSTFYSVGARQANSRNGSAIKVRGNVKFR